MVWVLLAVAILFFTATLLVVKTFKKNQQAQEDIEYLKLRIGLVNQYQANVNRHKTCHWCALGAFMVRGFAITLFIGVALSMFTAIVVTRTFLRLILGRRVALRPSAYGVVSQ